MGRITRKRKVKTVYEVRCAYDIVGCFARVGMINRKRDAIALAKRRAKIDTRHLFYVRRVTTEIVFQSRKTSY